jgi:hypothetical protein
MSSDAVLRAFPSVLPATLTIFDAVLETAVLAVLSELLTVVAALWKKLLTADAAPDNALKGFQYSGTLENIGWPSDANPRNSHWGTTIAPSKTYDPVVYPACAIDL